MSDNDFDETGYDLTLDGSSVGPTMDTAVVEPLYIPAIVFETPEEVMEDAARRPNAPGRLYRRQVNALMSAIQSNRVQTRERQSYVEGHDILAHLTRIFGFGNWEREVLTAECAAQWRTEGSQDESKNGRYNAVYRATVRLTVKDIAGRVMSRHEDAGTWESTNQKSPGDAHDLALKGAVSIALKRCARDYGDQFGLSLYWSGSTAPCMRWSLGITVPPQSGAAQQQPEVPEVPAAAEATRDTPESSEEGYF